MQLDKYLLTEGSKKLNDANLLELLDIENIELSEENFGIKNIFFTKLKKN